MRQFCLILTCALWATAAPAQEGTPFSGEGYLLACGEEGCFVGARGYTLFVPADGGAAARALAGIAPLSAVRVSGDLTNIGDANADLALTEVEALSDDLNEGNLRALQGAWQPVEEESPFHIEIYGLDWAEMEMDQETARFQMTLGTACASGVEPGGMTISLYRYGDDPAEDACWQLEYIDDTTLTLRDVSGVQGQVGFTHIQR